MVTKLITVAGNNITWLN